MNQNNTILIIIKVLLGVLVVLVTVVVLPYVLEYLINDSVELCVYKRLTGHECWGCGLTRASYYLLKLDFKTAYEYNNRIFIVFPMLVVFFVRSLFTYLNRVIKGGVFYGRKSS